MTPEDLKYFKDQLKLIFSSLFARNMSYAVFGIPDLPDNQILFTNVDPDQIAIYESDPNYFFHLVTLKDERFCKLLFEQYPVLLSHVVLLNVRAFMTCINKNIKEINESKISLSGQEFQFSCCNFSMPCGLLTSEFTANHYYTIYKEGIPEGEDLYKMELSIDQVDPKAISYIEVYNHNTDSLQQLLKTRCMMLQGKNLFSTKEYLVKAKEENYKITLTAGGTSKALKVMIEMECPSLSVVSVQPGIRYYAHPVES